MDDKVFDFDKIHDIDLKKTMEDSYIDYAMSVIASRALPDVRDGMKPVQRRILWSMIELNNGPDKPHRKCARIVGDTMGKYHPHGDSSIYEALVKLAQDFNTRYPLVDGHGNFGSIDGDGAAAMRYTEARLSKISMEMTADINKNTVDFIPNFDETEKEPAVLPARYPNLLVNGTTGIAVGMATNIPPHNLREVIGAVVKLIDNRVENDRDTDIEELMEIVKGPDFPTGATIIGHSGIEEAYRTGRGKIRVQAVTNIEPMANGKNRIVVTEIPYMVNKAKLIEKIAELVREKRVDGITDLRDESDRSGMRIAIELRRDVNPQVMLNQLFKHTQLMDSFGVIMLALVNNEPKILNLKDMLVYYLEHQKEVVTRRTQYDLNKAEERAHILQGLLIALDHIDEVIRLIRAAATPAEAKLALIDRFGLSDAQAQAIVDMRLRALTGLEREKLEKEFAELQIRIQELKAILADEKLLLGVIREEILLISDKYGDERRTSIGYDLEEINMEDLVADDATALVMTELGYIKRMSLDNFKSQRRGGRGIRGMQKIDDDNIRDILVTTNHKDMLFFTNQGRVYKIKAYEIPEAGRTSRGVAVVNIIPLQPDEAVRAIVPIDTIDEDSYMIMATKNGLVKKTPVREYSNIRKTGLLAITLREDDQLISAKIMKEGCDVLLVSRKGMSIRFHESDARAIGRTSMGVMGINLDEGDEVVSMQLVEDGTHMLFVSEKGMGKKTAMEEFNIQNRGGKGLKCYRITDKTGDILDARAVNAGQELMMITSEGIVIRTSVDEISILGRITSGVKLIQLDEGVTVASMTTMDYVGEEEGNNEANAPETENIDIADIAEVEIIDDSENLIIADSEEE